MLRERERRIFEMAKHSISREDDSDRPSGPWLKKPRLRDEHLVEKQQEEVEVSEQQEMKMKKRRRGRKIEEGRHRTTSSRSVIVVRQRD